MRLVIKQKLFTLADSYNVFDEAGNVRYTVKNELFRILHKVHVKDAYGNEVGVIQQKWAWFLPHFEIYMDGHYVGMVQKEFTFFRPKYTIDYKGWTCDGDFFNWEYDVTSGFNTVAHISKKILHLTDTYAVDIANPEDEKMAIMLVIAIDIVREAQRSSAAIDMD